ncbi:MAG: c-type cytochrome [Polyangiaceae bacterium]|jgi:cytochrome c oxidase cbb3-type subunit 3
MSDTDSSRLRSERGHVYDGIVEHDNELPLWWQLTLYGAVLFALVYWFGRRLDAIETRQEAYVREIATERAADAARARARGKIDDDLLVTLSKDPATVAKGRETFVTTCAPCHRLDGGGNIGPNLTDEYWLHGSRPTDVLRTVSEGVPNKGMPSWGPQLGEDRVEAVVAFVVSIKDSNVPGGKSPQGELAAK